MKSLTVRMPTALADEIGRFAEDESLDHKSDALRELVQRGLARKSEHGDGFRLGILGGEPVKLRANAPRSVRNYVEDHARRHTGGDIDAAVAELLERGLHHHFMERLRDTFRRSLEPLTLAAQRERAKR